MTENDSKHTAGADQAPEDALAGLMRRAGAEAGKGLPPVERWNPEHCGELDMEIKADGTWFYMGTPIGREALVRLFSSVLIHEDGGYHLITPVEKVGLRVEDAPFLGVELHAENAGTPDQVLTLRTNVGDVVTIGPEHPLRFDFHGEDGQLKPYVLIRNRRGALEALLARPLLYQLVDYGEAVTVDGEDMFSVRSAGEVFPIMPMDELESLSA